MVAEHWLLLRLNWAHWHWRKRKTATSWQVWWQGGTLGRLELASESLCFIVQSRSTESVLRCWVSKITITDDALDRLQADTTDLVDTELVKFSRHLHYLLTQITSESARLVVRGNTELPGFEFWRLLARRFSLPGTALDISLLTRVLGFKFRRDHFEQDYSEWETLKARYERQSGSALPDSILVATVLSKTTGALQQHLRLNVRSLDTYETVRTVITAYYQSRHVTGFRSLSDIGPAPMDVGAKAVHPRKRNEGKRKMVPPKDEENCPSLGPLKGKSKERGKAPL